MFTQTQDQKDWIETQSLYPNRGLSNMLDFSDFAPRVFLSFPFVNICF